MFSNMYQLLFLRTKELSKKLSDKEPEGSEISKEIVELGRSFDLCSSKVDKPRIACVARNACTQPVVSAKPTLPNQKRARLGAKTVDWLPFWNALGEIVEANSSMRTTKK
jgi:hypothetical protein